MSRPTRLQALLDRFRHKRSRVAAVARDLADGRSRHVSKAFARHHEQGLDLRCQAAVREGHLELVLEIAVDANAADDDLRSLPPAEIDEQSVKDLDLHVLESRLSGILPDHRLPDRKSTRLNSSHQII